MSSISLLFPVVPVACDQWRMRSSCFAVDACSCLLCSCPPCSCPLCSLPTAWIFLLSLAVVFDIATPLRTASAPTVSSSTTPEPSSGELRVRMSSPLWRGPRWCHRAPSSGDPWVRFFGPAASQVRHYTYFISVSLTEPPLGPSARPARSRASARPARSRASARPARSRASARPACSRV